ERLEQLVVRTAHETPHAQRPEVIPRRDGERPVAAGAVLGCGEILEAAALHQLVERTHAFARDDRAAYHAERQVRQLDVRHDLGDGAQYLECDGEILRHPSLHRVDHTLGYADPEPAVTLRFGARRAEPPHDR